MIKDKTITDDYAIYNADCMAVMEQMKDGSVPFSVYSPPFAGLYQYSSDERDMSNNIDYPEFLENYGFCVKELSRLTPSGRMSAVHCTDITSGNCGFDRLKDFPGDIIRLHADHDFDYCARYHVWKEPLTIRNRTMMKTLSHKCLTRDSTKCSMANADYLLIFRKRGENADPVTHTNGLMSYAGERPVPAELLRFRGWKGSQLENRFSQWVWRQYASAFWDDVRLDRVLPYRAAKEADDERHVHPLQLDVIERACVMWSNPGEVVFTPFMGVGSEVYGAVLNGRKGVGVELKTAYYNQAVKNMADAVNARDQELLAL